MIVFYGIQRAISVSMHEVILVDIHVNMLTKEIDFKNFISCIFTILSFLYRTLLYSIRTSLIALLFAYLVIYGLNTAVTRETTSHGPFSLFVISIVLFIVTI